jgi:hypothetical protein
MAQRGRKSQLSLLEAAVTDVVPRPQPPAELTAEQSAEWIVICNSVPADYFSQPTHATLVQYCRHVVVARHLAELIQRCGKSKKIDTRQYRFLIREQRAETQAIYACLRSMRLTHLAIKPSSRSAIPSNPMPRPWET